MKIQPFCDQLETATAKSESVIAVFCDIRGFSDFSKDVESSDTANFLKHFYIKLLRKYFQNAVFAKPAGDGMLLIFPHDENNLNQISHLVFLNCFKLLKDFSKLFKTTPIINFETPKAIGFGIARGSASCLVTKDEILDYSGKVLNLSARLCEFARPSGLVIDGNFQRDVIPKKYRTLFQKKSVYVRGIAEDEPIEILYSDSVIIAPAAFHPIIEHDWRLVDTEVTVESIITADHSCHRVYLPDPPLSRDKVKIEFRWPRNNGIAWQKHNQFGQEVNASGHAILFPLDIAKKIIEENKIDKTAQLIFRIHYVPKVVKGNTPPK